MVAVTKKENHFHFEVEGLHKLWSLKSQLSIPADNIIRAYQNKEELRGWRGMRLPGTYIPGIITAGTFYWGGEKTFWDVVNKDNAVIIELEDESYQKLIIEVASPAQVIELLNS